MTQGLSELISTLPEKCIALMEDIDAAFHHGISRESTPPPSSPGSPEPQQVDGPQAGPPAPTGSRVSLSGLLNALDGIGAQEGRILFATTNNHGSLDAALCRPGRMDLHIEFHLASKIPGRRALQALLRSSACRCGQESGPSWKRQTRAVSIRAVM
jgi:chaperone BCS1